MKFLGEQSNDDESTSNNGGRTNQFGFKQRNLNIIELTD